MDGDGDEDARDGGPDEVPIAETLDDVLAGDDSGLCAGLLDLLALLPDVGAARWLLHRAGYLALVAAPGGYGFHEPFARDVIDAALDELAEAGLVTIDEDIFDDDTGDSDDPGDVDAAAGEPDGLEDPDEVDDAGEDDDDPGEEYADDPDDLDEDPNDLDESSFDTVTVDPDAGRIILARHVAAGTIAELGARACAVLDEAARPGTAVDFALLADGITACWDNLLPHLGAADDELVKDLLAMRGWGLYALTLYADVSAAGVIEFGEKLVADYELALGPGHPDAWEARRNLGILYGRYERGPEAIDASARLLADKQQALPDDHIEILGARDNLAEAYLDAGQPRESIRLLTESINQYGRLLGAEHGHVLYVRCLLGLAYARAGDVGQGIRLIEASIAAQEAAVLPAIRIDLDYWRNVLAELRGEAPARGEAQGEWPPGGATALARLDAEDGVAGRDLAELGLGGLGVHAVEEHADLEPPALEVGAQQRGLDLVGQLDHAHVFRAAADAQLGLAVRGADVADPLGDAARRDQVPGAIDRQQVDRGAAQLA
jgi:hypothetical protein